MCYQSCFMDHVTMNVLAVFLLCLAAACAVSAPFPSDKTVVYKYYANVKAGVIEPAQYASQFALAGQLHVKKDVSDPTFNNAYYVKLHNVKYGMHNGMVAHEPIEVAHELEEAAQQIQDPFLMIYDENNIFQGIKVPDTESGWSRNMKQGIASMMQLDFSHIQLRTPMKPHAFVTTENTIHGTCQVVYDVHSENPAHPETSNVFVVTKLHDMMNCSHFVQRVFDHVECVKCHVKPADDMTTSARRVFRIEQQGGNILIKHLVADSVINYFPYNARSEAHYLLTNMTLSVESVVPVTESQLPLVNFQAVPVIRDVTFNKPLKNYALHAAEDLTHGRRTVKMDTLVLKLKKMLTEAADYLDEHHLEAKEPDWKHGQTINRLQRIMGYMDLDSLEQVYNATQDAKTAKEVTTKNIFLGMIPLVGTTATCHFARNVIRKHKVTDARAMSMLIKLPLHVKVPSEKLLLEMEDLLKLDDTVALHVKKASILCFSILIRKTFIHHQGEVVNPLLEKYVHRFLEHVKNEQTYDMKVVYLMAMKNVQVGNIEKFLEPIVRGEVLISDHPHDIRLKAMFAIKNAIADNVEYTHNLFWPILANVAEPFVVRAFAYDILISQLPNMERLMNIYWLMVNEPNNHLYNFHLTTLKGLANSVDPCLTPVREMARKVIRYTKVRPNLINLSSRQFFDYTDPVYEHGESVTTKLILDELTGLPNVGYVKYHESVARKTVNKLGVYWNIHGLDDIMKVAKREFFGTTIDSVTNKNVINILNQAAHDMPVKKPIHIDLCFTLNGNVVVANYYNENSFNNMLNELMQIQQTLMGSKINIQEITYDNLYEMQVPTDMGLQGVLSTRMPHMLSMRFNNLRTEVKKPSVNMKLEVNTRVWRHGEYVMSIHNPIADVWHSVRRSTVQDVALPINMNIGYNHEAKSLKVTMPRLPVTELSHTGVLYHAKNLVTISKDEQDLLKECCATCQHHEVVTTGKKKNHHSVVDSKDFGLKYSMSVFDCENEVTPITKTLELYRALSPKYKNTWNSKYIQYIMGLRQKMINDYISPEMGNCGALMKMEPSIIYPTSQIDLNLRVNLENVDHLHDKVHMYSSNKVNIRGTLDAKAASTNQSVRSWDMNISVDMHHGRIVNNFKVQITRITPEEKNLKICIDAQKSYPALDEDVLKLGIIKQETNTKFTVTAGFTADDKCVRDEMLIMMTVKGEMTEEQKKHYNVHGACAKDMQNPQFHNQQGFHPRTWNCLAENTQHTSMKRYVMNVSYKKVPIYVLSYFNSIENLAHAMYFPYLTHNNNRAESGNAKMILEYSPNMSHIDVSVVTPVNGYVYTEIPLYDTLFEGMMEDKLDPHWHLLMDNTYFSTLNLYYIKHGLMRICAIYPQTIITLDNGVIPFVTSDQWVLISGDYIDQTYAIFVKSVEDHKFAVKMYIAGHEMEIMPTNSNTVVTIDNEVVNHEKGLIVPADEPNSYAFRLVHNYEHLVIQSQLVRMNLYYVPDTVAITANTVLQGHISGLCGHIDGTHKEKLPKVYTVANL